MLNFLVIIKFCYEIFLRFIIFFFIINNSILHYFIFVIILVNKINQCKNLKII